MKVNVVIEVKDDCRKCPYCTSERTIGAGYALDYFCTHMPSKRRKIMGYVEYSNDIEPIPNWCPFLD